MKTRKIIDLISGILFIYFIYIIQLPVDKEVSEKRNMENLSKLPDLKETQDILKQISQDLNAVSIHYGGLKYSANDRWIYSGAEIKINKCIHYNELEKIIYQNGFDIDFKRKKAILSFRGASHKKDELFCDTLYFDYSWYD